ncbi:helix-turn-helix domain-containing protein [Fodinicurvata halophila]|uniref:helix-turn-helix domain-containing protein n=1 Tax=Fodinicurvata halophila TaxID=1419723 RepID=UPI00363A425F
MSRQVPVGHRLRRHRKDLGLTQMALAEAIGISPSYLNLIEHNRRPIGGGLLMRLADALGLEPGALSGSEDGRLLADLGEMTADPVFEEAPWIQRNSRRPLRPRRRWSGVCWRSIGPTGPPWTRWTSSLSGSVTILSWRMPATPY